MTIEEASERYNIPMKILKEYEEWGLCGAVKKVMGAWHYDDSDLEKLSLIMTLHDVGITTQEVEAYMRLFLDENGTGEQQMEMLHRQRDNVLDEIHFREKQLERLDYLRHEIRREMNHEQEEK